MNSNVESRKDIPDEAPVTRATPGKRVVGAPDMVRDKDYENEYRDYSTSSGNVLNCLDYAAGDHDMDVVNMMLA